MPNPSIEQFVHRVAAHEPRLVELLDQHLRDNDGELHPEEYFGRLTEWVDARMHDGEDNLAAAAVLDDLEAGLDDDDADIEELVAVAFLERLDDESPVLVLLSDHARDVRNEVLQRAP